MFFAGDAFDILLAGLPSSGEPETAPAEWAPDGPKAYTYRFASGSLPAWPTVAGR